MSDDADTIARRLGIDVRTTPAAGQRELIIQDDRGERRLTTPDGLVLCTREEWLQAVEFAKVAKLLAGVPMALLEGGDRRKVWQWIKENHR